MRGNRSTNFSTKKCDGSFELFDTFPRHVKEAIWTAPVDGSTNATIAALDKFVFTLKILAAYETHYPAATARTWGPDHPQAKEAYKPLRL